jgi:hypothetical protein
MDQFQPRRSPISRRVQETGGAFGLEVIAIMSTAYQAVLSDLGLLDQEDSFTLLVARRIIDLAAEGERDPDRLRATALAYLTKRPPANPFGREATESRRR